MKNTPPYRAGTKVGLGTGFETVLLRSNNGFRGSNCSLKDEPAANSTKVNVCCQRMLWPLLRNLNRLTIRFESSKVQGSLYQSGLLAVEFWHRKTWAVDFERVLSFKTGAINSGNGSKSTQKMTSLALLKLTYTDTNVT